MDWPTNRRYRQANYDILDYGREPALEFDHASEATGYWFLAAVLFAFLAAGIIVYRAGNTATMSSPAQAAAIQTGHPAAQADPLDPQPLLQAR